MGTSGSAVGIARSNAERVAVWILALVLVGASAGGWYVATPHRGSDASIETVRADERVELSHRNGVYALEPVGEEPTTALVFYPGARVHPDAYLAALAPLAARADIVVYIPEMPLGFAVLNPDAAEGSSVAGRESSSGSSAATPSGVRWRVAMRTDTQNKSTDSCCSLPTVSRTPRRQTRR